MEVTWDYASDLTDRQWQIIRKLLPPRCFSRSAADLPTAGDQRDPLRRSDRLPMADAAVQFPQLEHRLQRFLAMAKRWDLAENSRRFSRENTPTGREKTNAHRGDIDSQSVRTAEGGQRRGYDANKKFPVESGIWRWIRSG